MSIGKEFALLYAVLFLPGMLAQGDAVDPRSFENIFYHIQLLAVSVPQILLVVALSDLRRPGSSLRFGWRMPVRSDIAPAVVALIAAWVTAGVVSLAMGLVATGNGPEPAVAWSFRRFELIPLVLISSLAIGYREELFYRAYLTDRAEEARVEPRLALGAGALLFASGHLYQGAIGFVLSLAIGLVFGAVYYRTRSLHGIAVAHALYNFAILLASGFA